MAWKAPLEWYWKNVSTIGDSTEETDKGVTWIEMVLDFEISTRVMLTGSRITRKGKELTINIEGKGPDTVRQRAFNFARASRSLVEGIGKGELKVANTVPTLTPFGGRPMTGPIKRLALLQPLAVFKEMGTQAVTYKSLLEADKPTRHHWNWAPRYIGMPKKLWTTTPTILKEARRAEFRRDELGKPKWRIRSKESVASVTWQHARRIGQKGSPRRVARRIKQKTEVYKIQFINPPSTPIDDGQNKKGLPLRSPSKRRLRIRGKTNPQRNTSRPYEDRGRNTGELVDIPGLGRDEPPRMHVYGALTDHPLVQRAVGRHTQAE